MSGTPLPIAIPPGINKDISRYTAKMKWWDGNLVRWNSKGMLKPVGGWVSKSFGTVTSTEPFRKVFSWRDNSFNAWMVLGSADKVYAIKILDTPVVYDITPSDLVWTASGAEGYGSGQYGSGAFGIDQESSASANRFADALWSFHNFGQDLVAVHSGDGRLFSWSPSSPTGLLTTVSGAPIGNRLVVVTDERFCMVMGGTSNPRRVKWCSRENLTDWTPSSVNSAGGFELDTPGVILASPQVPNATLVLTDIDVHIIEYANAPDYYSRRRISDATGTVGSNANAVTPNGVMFLGPNNYWVYNGGVSRLECTLSSQIFDNINLARPNNIFMGINEINQEVWTFYPGKESPEADRALIYSYEANPWWSKATLSRTAWLNPIWQTKPLAINDETIYEHENGWTDNGAERDVWAETGSLELNNGEKNVRVDRIYTDTVEGTDYDEMDGTIPYSITFKLKQAPQAEERTVGPISLNADKGYTTTRFRARQVSMRIDEVEAGNWGLGTLRLRVKEGGSR